MIHIETGQRIGPYEVIGFLGRGAFAQVFAAEDSKGKTIALKIGDESGGGRYLSRFGEVTGERSPERISPDETPAEALFLDPVEGGQAEVLDNHEVDELLRGEANKLRAAEGEGVVALREVLEVEGRPVLAMELLKGSTLREKIRSLEGVKLRWLVEAARIVEHHVESGHWDCHGDLKPENLFITENNQVRVLDPVPSSDRSDFLVGTPHYNPFLRHDSKGDAQALAIMVYELLCGALPFDQAPWEFAGTDDSAIDSDEREMSLSFFLGYPRPRELNPRAPRELEQAVYLALCDENFGLSDLRRAMEDFLLRC